MRKEATINNTIELSRVSGYHGGSHSRHLYFRSDRYMVLDRWFNRPDGQPLRGYGLEIESECSGFRDNILAEIYTNIIFKLFPDDLFKMEHDGSLASGRSAEVITQIMTKSFIRNHYKDFKSMYDVYFRAFGISCADSGNCGMHVNISNALFGGTQAIQDDAIRKLFYFVNRNYTLCCKLFKRNERRTMYCGQMACPDIDRMKTYRLTDRSNDHGVCINLSHYEQGRIELRLVGGQPDYYAFRNTMETVFWLVEHLHMVPWSKLNDLATVFKGCNQYVCKRLADCGIDPAVMDKILENRKDEDLELHNG